MLTVKSHPERIVCLTEESVETLYMLGKQDLIVGVSGHVKRPAEALKHKKVTSFMTAKIEKILELEPDLAVGFSDIQKDLARDLIGAGVNVWIANHRSIPEILEYIIQLGSLVDARARALELVEKFQENLSASGEIPPSKRPKVYFEEWPEPMISGIRWVSELIEHAGGTDIFDHLKYQKLAKGRFIQPEEVVAANPDIIFGCWCGKKVDLESIKTRPGWDKINAVQNNRVFELMPEIFLQPGPAPLTDGLRILREYFGEL